MLTGALDRTQRGSGCVVIVTGDAGVGKSALCRELSERASARGMMVLTGRAVETSPPLAYRPVAEALMRAARQGLSPWVRRRHSPWPPREDQGAPQEVPAEGHMRRDAPRPAQIHQVRAGPRVEGRKNAGSSRTPFRHARRIPHHLAVLARPGFVRAAPALPGTTRIRLPSASPPCCDRTKAKVSHLRSSKQRLTAQTAKREDLTSLTSTKTRTLITVRVLGDAAAPHGPSGRYGR